jgi:hypothetical protein
MMIRLFGNADFITKRKMIKTAIRKENVSLFFQGHVAAKIGCLATSQDYQSLTAPKYHFVAQKILKLYH